MEYLFALLHKEVIEKESILFEEDSEGLLSFQFLQLQDECQQLMRLETLALFPYIREQLEQSEQVHVNPKTAELLHKSQQKVLTLMNKMKTKLNHLTSYKTFTSEQQIIINDLFSLEIFLQDWIYLIRHKVLNADLKQQNYECGGSSPK